MLNIRVEGDAELIRRLEALPPEIRKALKAKTQTLAFALQAKVVDGKLSGQVLKRQTGALSRSIKQSVEEQDTAVKGRVFSDSTVRYAARHEFGFDGEESVRAHERTIKQAFGRAISPKTILAGAFTRHAHTAERSFLRSALSDMRDEILEGLTAAVRQVLKR